MAILDIIKDSLLQFVAFFGLFLLSGFALTLLSRWTNNIFKQSHFPNAGTYLFGWLGVPVHEFCHAFFCKVFFHKVTDVKWFDPKGASGAHGSVTHTYHPWNLYQRIGHFFIGLGPVLLGPCLLALAYWFCVPEAYSPWTARAGIGSVTFAGAFHESFATAQAFFKPIISVAALKSIGTWVFAYIAVCICSQIELSREDLNQAALGLIPIFGSLLFVNGVAWGLSLDIHSPAMRASQFLRVWTTGPHVLAVVLAAATFLLAFLFCGLTNVVTGRPFGNPFR